MSFEGYNEFRCRQGHTTSADVYAAQPTSCHVCGERWTEIRTTDQTNGTDDTGPWRQVEYRSKFNDYVRAGYSSHKEAENAN